MVNANNFEQELLSVVDSLSEYSSYKDAYHQGHEGVPFPSATALKEIVERTREILFPGYFGNSAVDKNTIKFHIGVNVEKLSHMLYEQVLAGICFDGVESLQELEKMREKSKAITKQFILSLPELRDVLMTDVEAAYLGDPAAKNYAEIILAYPTFRAVSSQRMAHKLLQLDVPFIPRMITEMAHTETGIDIHPGATIGKYFAIDHGTGVVIGETAIIGDHVKLYQGVTLGAKSFKLDDNGNPIKNIPRHPIVKDNVIIYSHATVLGRITVGEGAIIGANLWITKDVEPGEKVVNR